MSGRKITLVYTMVALCLIAILSSNTSAQNAGDKCIYPGDCYRHGPYGTNIGWGKCENKSAWRQKFIHTTVDERMRMRKSRGKSFDKRIVGAYELTMEQRKSYNVIRDDFFGDRRLKMGKQHKESKVLLDQLTKRIQEYANAGMELINGDDSAMSQLPKFRENVEINDLRRRFQEIIRDNPFDWSNFADRIEDMLPPEQAKRGRARLAAKFPFTVSSVHGQKLSPSDTKSKNDVAIGDAKIAIDRWDAYVLAFKKRHQLTSAQSTAATSILKELRETRAQLSVSMASDLKRYENNKNSKIAQRRYELFELDVEDIFETLVIRLDALLTTAQRQTTMKK